MEKLGNYVFGVRESGAARVKAIECSQPAGMRCRTHARQDYARYAYLRSTILQGTRAGKVASSALAGHAGLDVGVPGRHPACTDRLLGHQISAVLHQSVSSGESSSSLLLAAMA